MDCKQALSLLADYYDQKLADGPVRELKAHLKTCPSCSSTFSALKNINKLVNGLPPERLPRSLRSKIIGKASATIRGHTAATLAETESQNPVRGYAKAVFKIVAVAIILTIGIATPILITHKFSWSKMKDMVVPQEVTILDKEAFDNGTSNEQKRPLHLKPMEFLPRPELPVTISSYNKDTLEKAAVKYSVVMFAQEYRVIEAKAYQEMIISDIIKGLDERGHETSSFKTSMRVALNAINKPALPSYAEEAVKDGKEIWIIVVNWEDGGEATELSRISAFAIEPSAAKIVDFWPKTTQDMNVAEQRINPHKTLYCVACHPNFDNTKRAFKKADWRATARSACIHCHNHKRQYSVYAKSIHGQLALAGKTGKGGIRSPTCADCHSGHSTLALKDNNPRVRIDMRDQAKTVCGNCHKDYWKSYNDYYHGKAYKAHAPDAPACWDCHGYHDIQPSKNPDSHVALANLPKTCKKCHSATDLKFVQYERLVHKHEGISIINTVVGFFSRGFTWVKQTLTHSPSETRK